MICIIYKKLDEIKIFKIDFQFFFILMILYKLLCKRNKGNTFGNNPAVTNCAVAHERDNRKRFQHPISDTAFFAC